MDRKKFIQRFSRRLNSIMSEAGYKSTRSRGGIDISKLANISGCSYQMARKYSLGQALPELHIVSKIATWLNTSPSWLLFGDNESSLASPKSCATIEIDRDLLKYILDKCSALFPFTKEADKVVNYIVDVIYDVSHLNADNKTILKIIDMMFSSALQLNKMKKELGA